MYTLPPSNWELAQLFDGKRSYEEIAELYSQAELESQYDAETVREFASDLEANDFWYKTPQEKNILLMKQSLEERRKKLKAKSSWADLSTLTFPAFNPDRFLTWLYGQTKFIYTPWFTVLTLIGFSASGGDYRHALERNWRDTVEFYNFSNKTWSDVFILYTAGTCVIGDSRICTRACLQTLWRTRARDGLCARVSDAGFLYGHDGRIRSGTRYQRLIISLAGIWSELMLCSIATPIWWGTPPRHAGSRRRVLHHDDDRNDVAGAELESADQARRLLHAVRDRGNSGSEGRFDGVRVRPG